MYAEQRLELVENNTRPEQVDVARVARRGARSVAFKQVDALWNHAETTQKIRPELLGVRLLCVALVGRFPLVNTRTPVRRHRGEVFRMSPRLTAAAAKEEFISSDYGDSRHLTVTFTHSPNSRCPIFVFPACVNKHATTRLR